MKHLTPGQMRWLSLGGTIYALAFHTSTRRFLGLSLSAWLQLLPLALALVALLNDWDNRLVLAGLVLFGLLRLTYWLVRRRGYKTFIPDPDAVLRPDAPPVPDSEQFPLRATGIFAVSSHEAYLLDQRPAQYWHTPLGDHVTMVQHSDRPRRFLYQVINAATLVGVEPGFLIAAGRPRRALALTFYVTWGPEFVDESIWYYIGAGQRRPKELKQRTIYFTFDDEADRQRVWQTIAQDLARQPAGETAE